MVLSAGLSDIGRKRQKNEDCYLLDSEHHLYLVADGMGGYASGEEAAKLTATTVDDFVSLSGDSRELTWPFGYDSRIAFEHNVLKTALLLANLRVCQVAEEMEHYAGMGSTVVVAWIRQNRAFYSHLGDSRLYLLRNGKLEQLTEDHTLVQEQLNKGIITPEEARNHRLRNVVTHANGVRDRLEAEIQEQVLQPGDQLLLCCDGLTDHLETESLRDLLLCGDDLQSTCQKLVDAANEAGGEDNVTALLVHYTT
ncbi:Stp1/IreP family PP2C-type Ser/Thr phosphatase [Acidobacteria bacterium AH-259-G07]|nr:Stp1/IreP family PP2C-type Ser/Thr phosphatase [Acidobacteria bacterium AH-259-G07]